MAFLFVSLNYTNGEIKEYVEKINLFDKKATNLCRQAIVDTISNTITLKENGEIFVSTGDIPAM